MIISRGALVHLRKFGNVVHRKDTFHPQRWHCIAKALDKFHCVHSGQTAGEGNMIVVRSAPTWQAGDTLKSDGISYTVSRDLTDSVELIVPAKRGGALNVAGNTARLAKSDVVGGPDMNDREFFELQLRATICPQQCGWPKPESILWRRLHAVPDEARERAGKAYTQMDEIDGSTKLPLEDKQHQRYEVLNQALAEFEASKTLVRAREAVRRDASPAALKALEQAEAGWERAMNKIAERAAQTKAPGGTRRGAALMSGGFNTRAR